MRTTTLCTSDLFFAHLKVSKRLAKTHHLAIMQTVLYSMPLASSFSRQVFHSFFVTLNSSCSLLLPWAYIYDCLKFKAEIEIIKKYVCPHTCAYVKDYPWILAVPVIRQWWATGPAGPRGVHRHGNVSRKQPFRTISTTCSHELSKFVKIQSVRFNGFRIAQ